MPEGNGWWSTTPQPSDHVIAIHHCVPIAQFLLPTFFSIKITLASRCCQTCYMASIIPERFVPFHYRVQFILHIHIFNNVLRMLSCRVVYQWLLESVLLYYSEYAFVLSTGAVWVCFDSGCRGSECNTQGTSPVSSSVSWRFLQDPSLVFLILSPCECPWKPWPDLNCVSSVVIT